MTTNQFSRREQFSVQLRRDFRRALSVARPSLLDLLELVFQFFDLRRPPGYLTLQRCDLPHRPKTQIRWNGKNQDDRQPEEPTITKWFVRQICRSSHI